MLQQTKNIRIPRLYWLYAYNGVWKLVDKCFFFVLLWIFVFEKQKFTNKYAVLLTAKSLVNKGIYLNSWRPLFEGQNNCLSVYPVINRRSNISVIKICGRHCYLFGQHLKIGSIFRANLFKYIFNLMRTSWKINVLRSIS